MSSNLLCAVNGSANFCQVLAEPALSAASLRSSAEPAQVPGRGRRKAKETEPAGMKKEPVQNSKLL